MFRDDHVIPVTVKVNVEGVFDEGESIPVSVVISNGLSDTIGFSSFSLTPNEWNGETINLSLVDITRNDGIQLLYLSRPSIKAPREISGVAGHRIEPGKELTVKTHLDKWKIVDGWIVGKYVATMRVERLTVDGNRCLLSVHSEPFEFEIR